MRAFPLVRLVLLTLVLLMSGCSLFGKKKGDPLETLPVDELYKQGVESMEFHNWDRAGRTFTRLIARFPFGPYTEQSQLDLAYVQYKNGKPDDAYSTVNRFIKTYPTHKHVDYAFYLRGLINFNREAGFIERYFSQDVARRDQSNLRQSFDDFAELAKRYPNSHYADDARQRMIYLRDVIAQAELNTALFYLRRGAYVGAANRAKNLVENFQRTPQATDALAVMAVSYRKLGQDKLADDAERVLKLNEPDHPFFRGDFPHYKSNWWKLVPLGNRG